MRKFLFSVVTLCSLVSNLAFADDESAEALLLKMNQASQQSSYELSYIMVKKNGIEPLLFRHAKEEQGSLAHLIYLSGPVREVIRRNNLVSYIEPGVQPFTVKANMMVAPVMPMLTSDIKQLSDYYDFVKIGQGREAGTPCYVVRVVPKDGARYSYVLWIDQRSSLPLRADLLDRDGEVIEQYRAISYTVSDKLAKLMDALNNVQLPEVLSLPESAVKDSQWSVSWVPEGFVSKETSRYRMVGTDQLVENQMFTDGLFSFSVYVTGSDNISLKDQFIRQGKRTLHTVVENGKEISVVGDIPPETAKRIAASVRFAQGK